MNNSNLVALGIGSNLGDRLSYLQQAKDLLTPYLTDIKISSIYESEAMMLPDSPPAWNVPFLNIVISGYSDLPPDELLKITQSIEVKIGRDPNHQQWSPRQVDIDILTYGNQIMQTPTLNIPHLGLMERQFFLMPMLELHPQWQFPVNDANYQKTIEQLSQQNKDNPFNTRRTDLTIS